MVMGDVGIQRAPRYGENVQASYYGFFNPEIVGGLLTQEEELVQNCQLIM